MKKECYPSFDYIAYYYVVPFVERWNRKIKCMRKREDEKAYVFDMFINEFIIYSSLVNVIKPEKHKHLFDKSYSTSIMAEYMSNRINVSFMESILDPVNELINIIESHSFRVVSSRDENPELKKNWALNNPSLRITALLETLYYLRCNLFHGEKEYSDDQVALLQPAIACLHLINKEILDIYKNKSQ